MEPVFIISFAAGSSTGDVEDDLDQHFSAHAEIFS